ncbi:hypothetical protein [Streptomyces sp. NPDC052225]|uniref:hypothetical protein n=1 Tax=Streptomyces sp. NPDC052225 TaxID=3154949 RepID=UPI00342F2A7D
MSERLAFTLTGRDELSRVLNGTGDSADRLRLRLAGLTSDANGSLRDLQGNLVSTADAHRRLDRSMSGSRNSFTSVSEAAGKLGEALKANLISLAPAAVPAGAALVGVTAQLAGQFGAVAVSAAAYGLALKPQIAAIGEAVTAQDKYRDAVKTSGATSAKAVEAQVEYQQQLAKLPPATRTAAVAVGLLKDNFQSWSDSLSGDVMGPFTKGVAVANALLPKTSGLVRNASAQFDRLITMVGGAISTPGFDALNSRFTTFADRTMTNAVSKLNQFLAKADTGQVGGGISSFLDYARANGPAVWDTLENLGQALINVLQASSDVGVGMLDVINALSGIVSAVPPGAIATMLQLAIAIKAVKLAAVGAAAAGTAMRALGLQLGIMNVAAAAAPGRLAAARAAIMALSRTAKLAMAGTGIGLLLIGISELASRSEKAPPDVDKLTTSLTRLGQGGKLSGEAVRAYGKDLSGLGDALGTLVKPSNYEKVDQFLTSFIGMDSTPVKNAKEAFNGLDEALAGMVSSGHADLAASALDQIVTNLERQGWTSAQVRGQLDDYKSALAGQALEQQLAAQSMGLFGQQALEVKTKLDAQKASADGLRQSIVALNEVNRSSLGGMIGFEAAIDASAKAARENVGALDMHNGRLVLNSERSRTAASALNDLAAKTDEAAGAARESGASWSTVNGIYERGRKQLIANAMQMGLTRGQAKALADQILKTPDKTAKLRGNLDDLKAKLADAQKRLKSVPDSRKAGVRAEISDLKRKIADAEGRLRSFDGKSASATVTVTYRSVFQTIGSAPSTTADALRRQAANLGKKRDGGLIRRASGGPIPGYPGGGLLRGPGTPTSDSILMWGSTGEYMIKAASVAKYGIKAMDAINAGELELPRSGRAAAPGRAAAAPASRATADERQPVTYNVYPRASVIDAHDLRLIQRQEEARQRVGRPR